jgi:hypothetical protein
MGKLVLFLKDATPVEILLAGNGDDRPPPRQRRSPAVPGGLGEHAAVVTILADSFLEDLGSTNGTLVNGRPVAKHFLRDRDQVDIGRQLIVYLADDGARAEPPPAIAGRDDRRELAGRLDGMADPGRVEPARIRDRRGPGRCRGGPPALLPPSPDAAGALRGPAPGPRRCCRRDLDAEMPRSARRASTRRPRCPPSLPRRRRHRCPCVPGCAY